MKNKFKVFIVMILTIFLCIPTQIVVKASTYVDMQSKKDVVFGKEWVVKFNKPLNVASVNTSNIKVIEGTSKYINTKVSLSNGNKDIIVEPVKNYDASKKYTLIITQNVKAANGKSLPKEVRMNFDTKNAPTKPSDFTVCVDPAQYYTENTGKNGNKAKDINLNVALKLGNELKERGFKVVYTRNSDSVSWSKTGEDDAKATIAKNAKADVLLSINSNSYPLNTAVKGIETYYSPEYSKTEVLANSMQDELVKALGSTDRGIKEGSFQLLKKTSCPSVVLELGFLSNIEEEKLLSSTAYQNNAAKAIANGLMEYAGFQNNDTDYESVVKISSVQDIKVNLEEGEKYTFPKIVQATMSNNSKKDVEVQWENDSVLLDKAGTYTYEGTINNYEKKLKVVIEVSKKGSETVYVKDISVNVNKGDKYSLPLVIPVTTESGAQKDVSVVWNTNSLDTSKVGVYHFVGTIKESATKVNLLVSVLETAKAKYKVVLDAGHGGYDPGAIGPTGLEEKTVALAVTLKVGNILSKNGVETIYTRTSDNITWSTNQAKNLQARCDISNNAKPNCFVSIHANSFSNPAARGTETFYFDGSAAGKKLAQTVQTELIKETGRVDRGIKTAGYYVLDKVDTTSILVETSFISNPEEEKLLATEAYRNKLAKAISTGILKNLGISNIVY